MSNKEKAAKRRKFAHSFKRAEQIQAGDTRRAEQLEQERAEGQLEEARKARQLGEKKETEELENERGAREGSRTGTERSKSEMVREELSVRLNDREYKNWLKAGRCLLILKDALHPYTDHHMRAFHGDLLNQNTLLRSPCVKSCKPRGNKLSSPCRVCSEWQKEILMHHRQPDATINWANCFPPHWSKDHWELAKAYMPRGQAKVRGADQCDASALLNLINYCKCFQSVDPKLVRQVIQYRNELMHSCEFRVKDEWMMQYWTTLTHFTQQFSHVPQMATVRHQIEDMLTVDLSICVLGVDQMDSAGLLPGSASQSETSAELVSQWEAELLQEILQECLHASDEDAETQDMEQLKRLGGFLQAHKDLGERFSTQLQAINSLEARE